MMAHPAMAPFMGSATIGFWRPTPPANSPGSGPQFATMTPWVLARPVAVPSGATAGAEQSGVRDRFQRDEGVGRGDGVASTAGRLRTGEVLERQRHAVLDTGRVRARPDAAADASRERPPVCRAARRPGRRVDCHLGCQVSLRVLAARHCHPIGDNDGNNDTAADPTWTPFLTTSAHPEYPSGHSNLAGRRPRSSAPSSAITSRSTRLGGMPGTVRSFVGFERAIEEMADARVFGGMHFRTACVRGSELGSTVASMSFVTPCAQYAKTSTAFPI